MLSGLALRTIYNSVFMVEKAKLKMQPLGSTHHAFLMLKWTERVGSSRVEGEAVQRELRFAKSMSPFCLKC